MCRCSEARLRIGRTDVKLLGLYDNLRAEKQDIGLDNSRAVDQGRSSRGQTLCDLVSVPL